MLVPLGVAATKWGICVHKVGYLCAQSGVFVGATLRGDASTGYGCSPSFANATEGKPRG